MSEYEVYLTHFEQAQAGLENATRTSLQLIPAFGGALNQAIFGTHDIMQMKRIANYLTQLSKIIESGAIQQDALDRVNEYITSDDGQEYIYLIVDKVKKTRNSEKIRYLKNLFLHHSSAEKNMDIDNAERYLNMIENLDIESLLILKFLSTYDDITVPKRTESSKKLKGQSIGARETPIVTRSMPVGINNDVSYIDAVTLEFDLEIEDLNYYHQQLITNGVAIDDGMGRLDAKPLKIMEITKRGEQLLKFINGSA